MADERKITIDPADFSKDAWNEMFYAGGDPIKFEYDDAEPLEADIDEVTVLAQCCRNKADRIRGGELGEESEPGEDAHWIVDLETAAEILERYCEAWRLAEALNG